MSLCSPGSVGHDFASATSAHGFGRVVKSTSLVRKAIWILFIVGGFCMATWMISLRFIAYFEYAATSDITIRFHPKLVFPAVTICNFNRYFKSHMSPEEYKFISSAARGIGYSYYAAVPESNYDYLDIMADFYAYNSLYEEYDGYFMNRSTGESNTKQDSLSSNSKSESEIFKTFSGEDVANFTLHKGMKWNNKTVKRCLFKGYECDLEKDFTHVFSSFGNCYTFNADGEKFQDQPGAGNGLQLTLDIQQAEYSEKLNWGGNLEAGIIFEIHPQWEPPEVESKGLAVGPGKHAYAGILRKEHHDILPPWGSCNPDTQLLHFKNYSLTGCILECKLKHIKEYCGCKLLHYPGNTTVCSAQQITDCVIWELVKIRQKFSDLCGNCHMPCNSTVFARKFSYADIPNESSVLDMDIMHGTGMELYYFDYYKENFVELDIYYEDLNIYRTIKRPVIESSALISDIGSQLGLFLGFSALTFMEVFEFFMLTLNRCFTNWKQRRVHGHSKNECKN